jgi:colicin import membrane protein
MAEEEKTPDVSEKSGKKRTVIIAAVAAVVVFAGVGGYAYASNSAYDSYESRVESAKESDSKLVKKIAEAQSLVKATKESDVLDKTVLDSLNKSVKTSETRKGIPDVGNVAKWNLWSISKAKTIISNDMTEANDSINAIGKAIGKVEASKTAKQVKDAKDTLDKTITDAENLYKDSEGKVQDNKTRESLKTALDNAKKTSGDKKADVKSLTAANDALSKAVKAVNDSKNAKAQADAQKQAQEQAQQAQAQAQSVGTPSGGYSGYAYPNVGGSYSGRASQSAPSYSNTGSPSGGSVSGGTSNGGTWDWKNDKDSMGGGFAPITKDNINPDGSITTGMDSHGNMW